MVARAERTGGGLFVDRWGAEETQEEDPNPEFPEFELEDLSSRMRPGKTWGRYVD